MTHRGDAQAQCPTYQPDQGWTCFSEGPTHDAFGCDVGCWSCTDAPSTLEAGGIDVHGRRFARPAIAGLRRDARGLEHDFRSAQAHRTPPSIDLERAACYDHFGRECFDMDVCDCHPAPDAGCTGDPCRCEGGESVGEIMRGLHPDCGAFVGSAIRTTMVQCRAVGIHGPMAMNLRSRQLFAPMFARGGLSSCTANALIECTDRVHPSQCLSGYYHSGQAGQPRPDWYNDGACERSVFHTVALTQNTAQLRTDLPRTPFDAAAIDAKNAALAAITSGMQFPDGNRLDRVDHADEGVGFWRRTADTPEDTPCDDPSLIVAYAYPNSYLKHSGCPVVGELIVLKATIELYVDAVKINRTAGPGAGDPVREVHPHARLRIFAECGVRARLVDPECDLVRPWLDPDDQDHTVGLTISRTCRGLPVVDQGVDEIVYVDDQGRKTAPPMFVRWLGYLGEFGVTPTSDAWAGAEQCVPGSEVRKGCLKLADALTGVRIEGWPYAADGSPTDVNRIHGGSVVISFRETNYDLCCGEGGGGGGFRPAPPPEDAAQGMARQAVIV